MRISLFTFSGTGNTMLVASMLCDSFRSLGAEAESYSMEKFCCAADFSVPAQADILGIGYPIHAFNAPKMAVNFARSLPYGNGKPVFLFKSSGEPFCWNASSSAAILRHLRRKGYSVMFERHFLMPYNILARYPDALAKQMAVTARKLCLDMARRILAGEPSPPKLTLASRLVSLVFRIQRPGAALNGRLCSANGNCSRCLKCVENCPRGNIGLEKGSIRFHWMCVMCMRCVMHCPQNAIRYGLIAFMAVNGTYDYERILNDENIPSDFVNENTKGYFRLFRKYYRWAETVTGGQKRRQTPVASEINRG